MYSAMNQGCGSRFSDWNGKVALVLPTKGLGVGERLAGEFKLRESVVARDLELAVKRMQAGHPVFWGDFPEGVHRRLSPVGNIVGKADRDEGVLCESVRYQGTQQKNILSFPVFSLVYYPAAADVLAYFKAGAFSRFSGPSEMFPGSVGMLQMVYEPAAKVAQIVALQSSVVHSDSRVEAILHEVGNDRPNRYFRWRYHLLDHAFAFTREQGISRIAIGDSHLADFPLTRMTPNHKIIVEKALKNDFKLSSDKRHLIDRLNGGRS
jgi:hypothetical protein